MSRLRLAAMTVLAATAVVALLVLPAPAGLAGAVGLACTWCWSLDRR